MKSLTPEQELMRQNYAKAQLSLVDNRSLLLSSSGEDVEPAEYHYGWSDLLLNSKENFAIEGYRESAKTQLILRSFLLHCLTFWSAERDYIVLIKNNATLARAKLKEIEREYNDNKALNGACIEIMEQSGDVFFIKLMVADFNDKGEMVKKERTVRIEAYGKGQSIRGISYEDKRPRIVVIDDPQDIEDSFSETVMENDWEWFVSDVKFCGKHTRFFLIGNNLGQKCILERVFANPTELKFRT